MSDILGRRKVASKLSAIALTCRRITQTSLRVRMGDSVAGNELSTKLRLFKKIYKTTERVRIYIFIIRIMCIYNKVFF